MLFIPIIFYLCHINIVVAMVMEIVKIVPKNGSQDD